MFFDARMVADAESFSPSAGKPLEVVNSWKQLGIPMEILSVRPVSRADFYLAHKRRFVNGVLDLRVENGFHNCSASVAESLPFTTGAMLEAAAKAIQNGLVAVAPCSGFHHAHYDRCEGFCTFNGLVVTAQVLKRDGLARRVGILDFDQHYGNGTDDCIAALKLDWIQHYTAGRDYYSSAQAAQFLKTIPDRVRKMSDCDVILYQAGADPHIRDPLGGWLTDEQLAERDFRVFDTAKSLGVPVAWNLAGGYQKPLRAVLDIHDQTFRQCWRVYSASENATA